MTASSSTVNAGGSAQFTLQVDSSLNPTTANISWLVWPAVGTISSSGRYTPPSSLTASQTVKVVALVVPANSTVAPVVVYAPIQARPAISVSLSPGSVTLGASATAQFTSTVSNASNSTVTWSLSPAVGSISSSGFYTAPSTISSAQTVTVKATSAAATWKSASATISLVPPVSVPGTVVLPLEIMGSGAATQTVQVNVPSGTNVSGAASLSLQIHGLEYQTEASVNVNNSGWIALNNANVQIQGLGANYGGIGGGFGTLSLLVPLPSGAVQGGTNTVAFQFNGTDGNSSGYRVLAFNLQVNGTPLIPASAFSEDDPSTWTPPSTSSSDIAAGKSLYQTATIVQPSGNGSTTTLKAHCGDCHTQDGRDLKYFNYSNHSIYARAMFHGLNGTQANQIVSYIRSLQTPAPAQARPWNPPYQPGPGLDSQPVTDWAAGAGLDAVLASDAQELPYIAPTQTPADFSPSGNLNLRNTPVTLQLIDWNHWLPRVHPLDAYGSTFSGSSFYADYLNLRNQLVPGNAAVYNSNKYSLASWAGDALDFRGSVEPGGGDSSWANARTAESVYGINQWNMVKLWELNQEYELEGLSPTVFGSQAEPRAWYTAVPFGTSPSIMQIPPGSPGIHNGSKTAFNYISFTWYYTQFLLNKGRGQECGGVPIDFAYYFGFTQTISGEGGPAAALVLASLTTALQVQNQAALGSSCPDWNLGRTEPIFLVSPTAPQMWSGVDSTTRANLLNAYIATWITTVSRYTPQQYWQSGQTSPDANVIPGLAFQNIADDFAYAVPRLHSLGLNQSLTNSLVSWAQQMWPSNGYNWNGLSSATCSANSSGVLLCSSDH